MTTTRSALVALLATAAAAVPTAAEACVAPAPPTVSDVTPTSAVFTSALTPDGTGYTGRFRIGRTLTYPVLLGHGPWRVRWQLTVATLKPGHRYRVAAQVSTPGCRAQRTVTFTTPREPHGSGAAIPPAVVSDVPGPNPLEDN
jgi:hypothetical protein